MSERSIIWDLISRDRASATNDRVAGSFDRLDKHTSNIGATMTRVGRVAGIMGTAMAAGAVAVGTAGVKTLASLETTQVGFTTLLGSAKSANDYISWMKKFAAATPFDFPGLVQSSRQLIGVGVDAKESKVILQDFGDTAGAVGMDASHFSMAMLALSQSISAGHIKLGDMNQLMNDGIPIWKLLSQSMGLPVPKIQAMISKGDLLTKDVLPKLLSTMHKDYGGSMAKQSETLTGLWSTLWDTINLGTASALQPFEGELKGGLKGAITIASKALQGLPGDIRGVESAFDKFHIGDVAKKIQTGWNDLFNKTKNSPHPGTVVNDSLVSGMVNSVKAGDWDAFGDALGEKIGQTVTGLGSVVQKSATNIDWESKGKSVGLQAFPFAVGFVDNLLNGVFRAFKEHPMDTVLAIISVIPIGRVAGELAEHLAPGITKGLLGAFSKVTAKWLERPVFRVLGFLSDAFKSGMEHALPDIAADSRALIQKGLVDIWYHYTAVKEAGVRLVHDVVEAAGSRVGWGIRELTDGGRSIARGLVNGLDRMFTAASDAAGSLLRRVGVGAEREAGHAISEMGSIAHEIAGGLVHGLEREAGAVVGEAEHLVSGIPGAVKKVLDIHSPSRVMEKIGGQTAAGLVSGLRGGRASVKSALDDMKSDISKAITSWGKDLTADKSKLSDLKSSYSDLKGSVHDSFTGTSITDRGTDITDVLSSYTTDIRQTKTASSLLAKLKSAGLSSSLLSQLGQGGTGAISLEQSILASGKSGISRLNADSSALGKYATAAGTTVANAAYAKSIAAETKKVAELTKATKDLKKALEKVESALKHPSNIDSAKLRSELYRILKQGATLAGASTK